MSMTSYLLPYLGNLHHVLSQPVAGTVLVLVSVLCGLIIGQERESKNKPAGLRTVTLICVGSTIFTLASILIVAGGSNDPGRIAAQVVTGIGFLGAGAIMREHGTIVGLTTAATIWSTAAIGVMIGSGFCGLGPGADPGGRGDADGGTPDRGVGARAVQAGLDYHPLPCERGQGASAGVPDPG